MEIQAPCFLLENLINQRCSFAAMQNAPHLLVLRFVAQVLTSVQLVRRSKMWLTVHAAMSHLSFFGHGIGSYFHGAPEIIPYENDFDQGEMMPGMVFTVEPILVEDSDESFKTWEDGWTFQTLTGARSAQFEHTILITNDGHEILTGPSLAYEDFGSCKG